MSEMTPITIVLPWPPSVNTYWRHTARCIKGQWRALVHISHAGRQYRKTVGQWCQAKRIANLGLTGRLRVVIDLYPPTARKCDVANYEKGLIDALEHARVFLNDEQIDDNRQRRGRVVKGGRVRVTIWEIPAVEPQQMELKA